MVIINYNLKENAKEIDDLLIKELKIKTGKKSRGEKVISLASFIDSEYVGGIIGKITFETCYIDLLAIKHERRGGGIGTELIKTLECEVLKLGIKKIHLSTQDYQAKEFYLKMNYEIAATIKDIPFVGTTRYIFIKDLN